MNIALIGCKHTTKYMLDFLHKSYDNISIITLSPELGERFAVADYYDMTEQAKILKLPVYVAQSYELKNSADQAFISNMDIDILFVIGWQRLIPPWFLDKLTFGAFGMHGSSENLPKGRGRSPMNWSIIEGRTQFYTNLFKYDPGIDSGDVVGTVKFHINDYDTAETCHYKNMMAMRLLISKHIDEIVNNLVDYNKQDDRGATYYPKRDPNDSLIDWSQSLNDIGRFIRAVTKPFNGAFTFCQNEKVIIWRANTFDTIVFDHENKKNGEVVEKFPGGKFIVKVKDGLLIVHEYSGPVSIGDVFDNGNMEIKQFNKNKDGFYDLEQM